MNEEEEKDILFDIDMQLYDEFNDTIASMYDHLGEIYTLRDIEELEKAEKEKERRLLREAIDKQQKVIDLMAIELSRRPLMIYLDNERDDRLVILDNPKEIIKYYTKKAEE